MAAIRNEDVEVLARQLLWDQIDRSAWHYGLSEEERTAAIRADVEAWWHLRAGEAALVLSEQSVATNLNKIDLIYRFSAVTAGVDGILQQEKITFHAPLEQDRDRIPPVLLRPAVGIRCLRSFSSRFFA